MLARRVVISVAARMSSAVSAVLEGCGTGVAWLFVLPCCNSVLCVLCVCVLRLYTMLKPAQDYAMVVAIVV